MIKSLKIIILVAIFFLLVLDLFKVIHLDKIVIKGLIGLFIIIFLINNFNRIFKTKKNENNFKQKNGNN